MYFPAVMALVLPLTGCTGDLVDLRAADGSAQMSADMSAGTDAMGGMPGNDAGGTQNVTFAGQVFMDLQTKGCTSGACHGGTQVPVLKGQSVDTDYTSILMNPQDAQSGGNSLILTKNLPASAGGVTHGGGTAFPSGTSDPTYQRWLAWITAGNPKGP